jgi:hypothetical protein
MVMVISIRELLSGQELEMLEGLREWLEMDELPTWQDVREFQGAWMYVSEWDF